MRKYPREDAHTEGYTNTPEGCTYTNTPEGYIYTEGHQRPAISKLKA